MDRPETVPNEGLVLFVVKAAVSRELVDEVADMKLVATPTSTHNTVKPLILIEELEIDHKICVVEKVSAPWFASLNPHKMVPAIEDNPVGSDRRLQVWESTSTLTYLADAYDKDGLFGGRNVAERAEVGNWLTLHTAALGPTAKYWLYFEKLHPEKLPKTTEKLRSNIEKQYDILEGRLSQEGQTYLALKDRPTIADIATLPFADEACAALFGLELSRWPHTLEWSRRMAARPAVLRARERVAKMGHE
ncbi:Fc.00g073550.m01.CDS01 [Cosmosporella sp. VM-42]